MLKLENLVDIALSLTYLMIIKLIKKILGEYMKYG